MATDPNEAIYDAIRQADAAGDGAAVARLSQYLKEQGAPEMSPGSHIDEQGVQRGPDGTLRVDITPDEPAPAREGGIVDGLGRGVRDVMTGAGGVADFVTTPVTAAMRTLGIDVKPYKELADNLADKLGLPRSETNAEKIISALNEGGILGLATAGAGGAASALPGVAGAVGDALAATPVADAISAATGNASGEVARQSGAGPMGQLAASLVGGGLGAGATGAVAKAGEALGERAPSELAQAFERQSIPALPADLGGHATRMLTAGTSKLTLGGIPLEQAAQRSVQAAAAARSAIADRIGNVARQANGTADTTGAGLIGQQGMRNWLATTEGRASKLYDAVQVAPETQSSLSNTREAFAEVNRGLASNPELSGLIADPRLQKWESAIQGTTADVPTGILDANGNPLTKPVTKGGQLSWQDLKAFRSYVGELAGKPALQSDTSQSALKRIYAGLSEDMRATAQKAGDLKGFERANSYYAARQNRISNVVSQILGKDLNASGEQAFSQIERWATGTGSASNSANVGRALRSMSPDEAATVRATMFEKLGTAPKGAQDETGSVFSPAVFVTHWNGLSGRAKSVLFPGADYRQSIDDLVSIAAAQKAAAKLGQGSPTAHLLQAGNVAGHVGIFIQSMFTNPLHALAIAGGAGLELATGKLLASPRFARWLASAPAKPNPAARLAHVNRLTAIAVAEPNIANDVLQLQEKLASAFTPASAAAQQQPAQDQREPTT